MQAFSTLKQFHQHGLINQPGHSLGAVNGGGRWKDQQ